MSKSLSRPARWNAATSELEEAIGALQAAVDEHKATMESALNALTELREEYEDWLNNMPEALQDSPTATMLQELVDLEVPEAELELDISELEDFVQTAQNVDLPRGFGRD